MITNNNATGGKQRVAASRLKYNYHSILVLVISINISSFVDGLLRMDQSRSKNAEISSHQQQGEQIDLNLKQPTLLFISSSYMFIHFLYLAE